MKQYKSLNLALVALMIALIFIGVFGCASKSAETTKSEEANKETVTIASPTPAVSGTPAVTATTAAEANLAKLKDVPSYSMTEGRGDPFIVPIGASKKKDGKISNVPMVSKGAGMGIMPEINLELQGILRSGNIYTAIISSPTGNYLVKPGDKCGLFNVNAVRAKAVVVSYNNNEKKLILGETLNTEKKPSLKVPSLPQVPGKASDAKPMPPQNGPEGPSNGQPPAAPQGNEQAPQPPKANDTF
jgi:hypothetical protein